MDIEVIGNNPKGAVAAGLMVIIGLINCILAYHEEKHSCRIMGIAAVTVLYFKEDSIACSA